MRPCSSPHDYTVYGIPNVKGHFEIMERRKASREKRPPEAGVGRRRGAHHRMKGIFKEAAANKVEPADPARWRRIGAFLRACLASLRARHLCPAGIPADFPPLGRNARPPLRGGSPRAIMLLNLAIHKVLLQFRAACALYGYDWRKIRSKNGTRRDTKQALTGRSRPDSPRRRWPGSSDASLPPPPCGRVPRPQTFRTLPGCSASP